MDAGNGPRLLWKRSKCSSHRSISPAQSNPFLWLPFLCWDHRASRAKLKLNWAEYGVVCEGGDIPPGTGDLGKECDRYLACPVTGHIPSKSHLNSSFFSSQPCPSSSTTTLKAFEVGWGCLSPAFQEPALPISQSESSLDLHLRAFNQSEHYILQVQGLAQGSHVTGAKPMGGFVEFVVP